MAVHPQKVLAFIFPPSFGHEDARTVLNPVDIEGGRGDSDEATHPTLAMNFDGVICVFLLFEELEGTLPAVTTTKDALHALPSFFT